MNKYINNNDVSLSEKFPLVGRVTMAPGEVRELPQDIADAWMNPRRQKTLVELYKEAEPVAIPETLPEDYKELLKLAKSMGIDLGKSPKKAEVIEAIENKRGA